MRKTLVAALALCLAAPSGCAWLTRDSDEQAPEKLYADEPCRTECCCRTKRGYYSYFRCVDRAPCESQGGICERADLARCSVEGSDEARESESSHPETPGLTGDP
jgi:hypothetical protein